MRIFQLGLQIGVLLFYSGRIMNFNQILDRHGEPLVVHIVQNISILLSLQARDEKGFVFSCQF